MSPKRKKRTVRHQTLGERVVHLEKDVYIIKGLLVGKLDEQAAGLRTVIDSIGALARAVARIEERMNVAEATTLELVEIKHGESS